MIIGTGIDICAIRRAQDALDRHGERFWNRILNPDERQALAGRKLRATALASRFAAKEAAVKALRGAPGVGWHDLEVRGAPRRPPQLVLHGPALDQARALGVDRVHLSLSHDVGAAVAMVIFEGDDPADVIGVSWPLPSASS